MHRGTSETIDPELLLKWSTRLLWVLLFISLMVVMGYFHVIITYTFLASVFFCILPALFRKDEEEREDTETNQIDYTMYFGYCETRV